MNIYNLFNKPKQLIGYSKRNIIVPQLAYEYALKQQHRIPEVEPYIKQHPGYAYLYAKNIIKDRWPEAEPYIARNPEWAFYYAKNIIKHRFPEAEPIIKQDPFYWNEYKEHFGIKKRI